MTFVAAVRGCLGKYAHFSGRSSRAEYWNFVLFVVLVTVLLSLIDNALFGQPFVFRINGIIFRTNGPFVYIFGLLVALPLLSAGWRRMHDTGRSGVYLLYPLIVTFGVSMFVGFMTGFAPILSDELWEALTGFWSVALVVVLILLPVSPLFVIWWLTRPSESGDNLYGPMPPVGNAH